jgi:hypothetical protein
MRGYHDQRGKHKTPLVHERMRDSQFGSINHHVAHQEYIQIACSRPPARFKFTIPAEASLYVVEALKQPGGRKRCTNFHRGVEICILRGRAADRGRLDCLGYLDHACALQGVEAGEGRFHRRMPVSDVASKRYVCRHFHQKIKPWSASDDKRIVPPETPRGVSCIVVGD